MKRLIILLALMPLFISAQSNCKIDKEVDKFTGDRRYYSQPFEWIHFIKSETSKDTVYFIRLISTNTEAQFGKVGVIILFKDGTKIEKPDMKIDCKLKDNIFESKSFFMLNKDECAMIRDKEIDGIRMYVYDRMLNEKKSKEIIGYFKCLIDAK